MTVVIHWRHRHVTPERLVALREVLEARPGPVPVVVALTGTGRRVRLPLSVAPDRRLRREVHAATGAFAGLPCPDGETPF